MEQRVKEIIASKNIVRQRYEVYRLYNTYKNMKDRRDFRVLRDGEEPDIEKLCIVHDISLLGAIGHVKNILAGLLTHEDEFGRNFHENSRYEISFEYCTEGVDHSLVVMNAYNFSTNQQTVIEALVVLDTTQE